ncbi:hypothetical protein LINGRAHAP2_LOCUS6514 [Linum grandiflorum]
MFLSPNFSLKFSNGLAVGTFISTKLELFSSFKEAENNGINGDLPPKCEHVQHHQPAVNSNPTTITKVRNINCRVKRISKGLHRWERRAKGRLKWNIREPSSYDLKTDLSPSTINSKLASTYDIEPHNGQKDGQSRKQRSLLIKRDQISTTSIDENTNFLCLHKQLPTEKKDLTAQSANKENNRPHPQEKHHLPHKMDRLLTQARSLRLTSDGTVPSLVPITNRGSMGSYMLVGKMITTRNITTSTMKGATRLPWSEAGEVDIRNEGGNIFVFTFLRNNHREAIWNKRPWNIAGSFLNLKRWEGEGDPRNICFQQADMWIHVHNLPPKYKSTDNMKVVGNLYFRYIQCDRSGFQQGTWRRYIRIFAEVRIDETLQVFGELPTEEKEVLEFKYEKITDYCLYCGKMGHSEGKCEEREEDINNGGNGDLPGIFDHCIRGGSAPRDLFGGLNVQTSPMNHSVSPDLGNRREDAEDSYLETRSQRGPTARHPIISTQNNNPTSGSGDSSLSLHSSDWRTPTFAELCAGTSLDTRGYQAMRAGLVPREIEMEMDGGEEGMTAQRGEGANPKTNLQSNKEQSTPICPPGFEAQRELSSYEGKQTRKKSLEQERGLPERATE